MVARIPWPLAVAVAIARFVLSLFTIAKRFTRSLYNGNISFWLISQRIMPLVAVVIPIHIAFQQMRLLDT